ncbi:hypothetical protein LMH87_004123 [Akanthomyces muscarius]|uniref:Uncharacterized protein n=2 Tax=Akanthomyces TaxID=150366 RepID=A0A162KP12_CORDF|nr:hypothetical protein LMH87_004123 [Akanthomyces muscarius]KAJ4145268.1 hypothetical protein LMH87_004123 [Akanthomyces muscarius]OAA77808.1 hypothetical protein LEL_04631 [Akanthomyces lecanii RCEF 1005]
MKFFSLAVAASSLAVVSASPVEKREVGGVLICTGPDATGDCIYQKYELEKCHQLKAPFLGNSATFAPDGDDFYCYPHLSNCGECRSPSGCTFGAVDFNYEHKFNLTAIQWNTNLRSFDCYEKRKEN